MIEWVGVFRNLGGVEEQDVIGWLVDWRFISVVSCGFLLFFDTLCLPTLHFVANQNIELSHRSSASWHVKGMEMLLYRERYMS